MIDAFRRVLVLAAHPDDEIACSGLIARLVSAGAEVELMTFSTCADALPEGFTSDDLVDEWGAASGLLGIRHGSRVMLNIPNRHFPQHRQRILDALDERRSRGYDLVLIPSTADIHQDHLTVAQEGIRAFKHATILGYEHPQNTVHGSRPAAYVRLDPEHMDLKLRHAATYRSQRGRPYFDPDVIRGTAALRGMQAGGGAAEAFEVVRLIT